MSQDRMQQGLRCHLCGFQLGSDGCYTCDKKPTAPPPASSPPEHSLQALQHQTNLIQHERTMKRLAAADRSPSSNNTYNRLACYRRWRAEQEELRQKGLPNGLPKALEQTAQKESSASLTGSSSSQPDRDSSDGPRTTNPRVAPYQRWRAEQEELRENGLPNALPKAFEETTQKKSFNSPSASIPLFNPPEPDATSPAASTSPIPDTLADLQELAKAANFTPYTLTSSGQPPKTKLTKPFIFTSYQMPAAPAPPKLKRTSDRMETLAERRKKVSRTHPAAPSNYVFGMGPTLASLGLPERSEQEMEDDYEREERFKGTFGSG